MATLYLAKQSMFGTTFSKNLFLKTICQIWTLWFKIKNRDTNRVRTVAGSLAGVVTVSGDSAEDFRELDSNS